MIITIVFATICVAFFLGFRRQALQPHPLPPGPPTLPLLGNLHQIPKQHIWRQFKKWHDVYGPIICLKFGSLKIISLGSYEVVQDLLEKRGSNYSSRPKFLADRVSNGLLPTFLPYEEKWKTHHRLHTSLLTIQASKQYQVVQDVESKQLLWELLGTDDFAGRFQRYASSQIFTLAFGKRMPRGDEPEVRELEDVMNGILQGINLGEEVFPILQYLPDVLAPWRKRAAELPKSQTGIFSRNMKLAETSSPWNWSKAAQILNRTLGLSEPELWYNIGALYEAGTGSTAIVLEVFVMACVLHPNVVQQAHQELDSVVGMRLPTADNFPKLPYIAAIIPDETIFDSPFDFIPDRWMRNPNLPISAFGFGRRACPGLYVGRNSVTMAITRLLWAYDISYAFEDGQKVDVDPWDLTQGIGVRPSPFKASFRVRSQERQQIIRIAWANAQKDTNLLLKQAGYGFVG